MILVQKITLIAFSLHDGWLIDTTTNQIINHERKKYSIRQKPSLLQYCSYVFDFQTILCGPMIFYNDYHDYLDGNTIKKYGLHHFPPVAVCVYYYIDFLMQTKIINLSVFVCLCIFFFFVSC